MNTKTTFKGIAAIILLGGAGLFGATVKGQEFEKASPTELRINTEVSVVVSLSDLKRELENAQESKQIEIDRSIARVKDFDTLIASLTDRINRAEQLGIKESVSEEVPAEATPNMVEEVNN